MLCRLALYVCAYIVAPVVETVYVSFLPEGAYRTEIAPLLVSALYGYIVFLGDTRAENFSYIVHVVPTVFRVSVFHSFDVFLSEVRDVVCGGGYFPVRKLVHHTRHIVVVGKLGAVHEFREVCVHGETVGTIVADFGIALVAFLRGDYYHASRCLQSVHCSRSSVFEDRYAFNVCRVYVIYV